MTFNVQKIRADFPILRDPKLVYLDNGATTQKPQIVIDTIRRYYESQNANIHRGVYALSQESTRLYEDARANLTRFINAGDPRQIIFTRSTTEAINLVAASWGRTFLKEGDEVIVSAMEHHSNIVPWQMICTAVGAKLRVIPMNDAGELLMEEYQRMLSDRTKFVSVVHLSNSLGTINDVKEITQMAHGVGAKVLADGAQWVAHYPTDVRDLDVDFYCFSGHKMFGPTGIGVLYGKRELLEKMPPYQGGGDMVESVTFEKTVYAVLPSKFEAGTPNIAGVIGLSAAVEYIQSVGLQNAHAQEQMLLEYATGQMQSIPGVRIIGTAKNKGGVISFVIENPPIGSYDIGVALDRDGIAVRTGHHCCQPVMDRMKISATARASFAMYNTKEDVDALVKSLRKLVAARPTAAPAQRSNGINFASAEAPSPNAAAAELAEEFELLGDRETRSQYVLDLGARLPHYFDSLKPLTQRIPGCMSEVYLLARQSPAGQDDHRVELVADANADIVRGLIAILEKLFSGQKASDVLAFDIETFFKRIGLDDFLSTQRRNGLAGMTARIRQEAQNIANSP